jgi:hypothetical protein
MPTSRRRVLTWARDQTQALKRLESYPGAKVEFVDGRWAVTAPKITKGT